MVKTLRDTVHFKDIHIASNVAKMLSNAEYEVELIPELKETGHGLQPIGMKMQIYTVDHVRKQEE